MIATSYMHVDLPTLHYMLRLPVGVRVLAVRADPTDATRCVVELGGDVPAGQVQAVYHGEQIINVVFRRWVVAP